MKYWIKIKNQKGQILVEVMVALAMVVIGLLGLLNLLSSSIGMNKVIADQYIASYLASEGIEIIKNIVDNNVADPTNGEGYARGLNPGTSENPSIYEVDYNSQEVSSLSGSLRYLWFDEENSKRYSYLPQGTQTPFQRKIAISYGAQGLDELVVQSTVSWVTRGGITSSIVLEDHFYNWRY
ncbi:MAG TPA: prepilin-type N-terminal cleavage/methylation domain-containing protein [Candidatus Paceibacterota bacterium]|nr:prepilin-type N-terminal cleavage/methylation domain-containing protein [Candidatus Paceibacterota bacterium]